MTKRTAVGIAICPICKKGYSEPPALSRKDNRTYICPTCGQREALSAMGLDQAEINKIVGIVQRATVEG